MDNVIPLQPTQSLFWDGFGGFLRHFHSWTNALSSIFNRNRQIPKLSWRQFPFKIVNNIFWFFSVDISEGQRDPKNMIRACKSVGKKWFCSQEVIPYRFVACIFVLKLQIRKSQERISENIQRKNFGFTKSHRFIRRKHPNSLSGSRLVYERVRRLRISEKSPLVRPY